MNSQSVTAWIDQLAEGNQQAAEQLWRHISTRVREFARRKLDGDMRRRYDEDDAAISAFHSLCDGLADGRLSAVNRDALLGLLAVITSRKISAQRRMFNRQKRGGGVLRGESGFADLGIDEIAGRGKAPDVLAEISESCAQLLDALPEEMMKKIVLLKFQGGQERRSRRRIAVHAAHDRAKTGASPADLGRGGAASAGNAGCGREFVIRASPAQSPRGASCRSFPVSDHSKSVSRRLGSTAMHDPSMTNPAYRSLTDRQLAAIDELCERFDHDWVTGLNPRIELFLEMASESDRNGLLSELLAIELEYRARRGDRPRPDEYLSRFPRCERAVTSAFAGHTETRIPDGPTTSFPAEVLPVLPNFRLIEEIGRGGMGRAWPRGDLMKP